LDCGEHLVEAGVRGSSGERLGPVIRRSTTESVARLTFTRAAARANHLEAMGRLDELENELLDLQADAD
jgi:hypothetical protein